MIYVYYCTEFGCSRFDKLSYSSISIITADSECVTAWTNRLLCSETKLTLHTRIFVIGYSFIFKGLHWPVSIHASDSNRRFEGTASKPSLLSYGYELGFTTSSTTSRRIFRVDWEWLQLGICQNNIFSAGRLQYNLALNIIDMGLRYLIN